MFHPSGGVCMTNQGCAQAGDIERGRIISGAIPEACGIGAAEPGSPVNHFVPMLWGGIGIGRCPAPWTGMRGMTGLLPFQTNPCKETFVAQDTPQLAPDLCIVSPVSPAPFRSS